MNYRLRVYYMKKCKNDVKCLHLALTIDQL